MQSNNPSSRDKLLGLRPEIPAIDREMASSAAEKFQNETLRPILKFQNELLVAVYRQYVMDRKSVLFQLPEAKRPDYISDSLHKDQRLRNKMLGMLIGLFTEVEYQVYQADKRELGKRAINMLVTRLQDQLLGK